MDTVIVIGALGALALLGIITHANSAAVEDTKGQHATPSEMGDSAGNGCFGIIVAALIGVVFWAFVLLAAFE